MPNDILVILTMFITRIALPVLFTFLIGFLLERALQRHARGAS